MPLMAINGHNPREWTVAATRARPLTLSGRFLRYVPTDRLRPGSGPAMPHVTLRVPFGFGRGDAARDVPLERRRRSDGRVHVGSAEEAGFCSDTKGGAVRPPPRRTCPVQGPAERSPPARKVPPFGLRSLPRSRSKGARIRGRGSRRSKPRPSRPAAPPPCGVGRPGVCARRPAGLAQAWPTPRGASISKKGRIAGAQAGQKLPHEPA